MVLKLIYFAAAGRAEATRMMFAYGNVPFEDVHFDRAAWPQLKLQMPFGQVPVLELEDGRKLAQSGAIERYVAKLAGLYPQDPLVAAFADQAAFLITEIMDLLVPTYYLPDTESKIKARQELLSGKMKEKMLLLQKLLEHQPYLAGDQLTFADFSAFSLLGSLKSGDMDGIPTTVLNDYPLIKAHFQRMASLEPIKARYANSEGTRASYRPE